MSDTLASILKQAEAHGILQRKVVKGGETEYLPTHPGEASTANKAAVTPPKPVQQAAALGLELRRQFGRGGTEVGVARARDLSNGRVVSEDTLTRMRSYFARHAVDAQADGWKDEANPSAGWIAWLLWGGDEGRDWVEGLLGEKYSPNQPRDESGRFGSGGGFAISPIQVAGDDANGYLAAIPKDSLPKDLMFSYSDSLNWHDGFSSENAKQESAIKAKGAESLDSDLEKSGLAGKSKIFEDGSAVQESWADTSDNHGGAQDALQLVTLRDSGGTGLSETEGMKLARSKMTEDDWKAAEVTHTSIKDRTQSYFKSKGLSPEDEIEVYRGLGGSSGVDLMQKAQPGDVIQITATHPLSSWSLDPMTARQFSGTLGVVVQSKVKVKDVFSHFSSGFGCASENEVILSGTATPRVRVLSVGSPTGKSLKKMLQVNLDGEKRNADWIQILKKSRYQSHSKALQTAMQAEKQHTGAMLALYPDTPPQFSLADSDLTPTAPDELHVTMAYLGDAADLDEEDRAFLCRVCAQIASEFSPIQAKLGGIGRFLNLEDDNTQAYYASVDSPDIEKLRARLVEVLGALGLLPDSDHGFTPHMTLAYVPVGKPAAGAGLQEEPVEFGGLSLSLGGERERFPFKASGAKQNIMLTYPDESKTQRFVWQQHFRGKSSHGDFRVQSGDYLVGWTIPDQNPGAITEPVETLAQATSAVNNPDLWKMNLATGEIKPREIRSGVVRKGDLRALPKGVEIPEDWLNEQGVTDKPDPGEAIPVGATRNYPGVFKIVDKGTVEHGAKKPWLAEYWIHGDKWGTQRWLFRLLERNKEDDDGLQTEGWEEEAEEVKQDTLPPGVIEAQPRSAVFWIFMQPEDQTPYVLGKEAVDKDWLPPKGVSALPKVIRDAVPEELQYWRFSGEKALTARNKLAELDIRELGHAHKQSKSIQRFIVLTELK